MENRILHGDSLDLLKDLDDNSVDSIVTDPPYGYSFMGKDWDKALPSIDIWKECVRVLKPGGFAFVMSAPRSDVHSRMCLMLEEAGFRIDFTPIAWTYATGFPKAMNIGKAVDKRMGAEREVIGKREGTYADIRRDEKTGQDGWGSDHVKDRPRVESYITAPASDKAKELDGSYAGYQPKPAWENVIVCMKPLDQKGYLDQALNNGKGVTWLDGVRIPFSGMEDVEQNDYERVSAFGDAGESETEDGRNLWGKKATKKVKITNRKPREENTVFKTSGFKSENNDTAEASPLGRFAANLIVQDDVLNTDDFSRYYDLDAWWESRIQELPLDVQATYPFLIVPKASKSEKNKGTDEKNFHPTVKPISLMSYLVTLGSREDDLVLDPFVGSGTTCIAAKLLNRKYIGMEMDSEYVVIAQERIKAHKTEEAKHDFF
jgi:DNA modification methylase